LKRTSNDKFVLAALSIPFNNSVEKVSFNYQPECIKGQERNQASREELLATSKML
jgi:hypothetical protein